MAQLAAQEHQEHELRQPCLPQNHGGRRRRDPHRATQRIHRSRLPSSEWQPQSAVHSASTRGRHHRQQLSLVLGGADALQRQVREGISAAWEEELVCGTCRPGEKKGRAHTCTHSVITENSTRARTCNHHHPCTSFTSIDHFHTYIFINSASSSSNTHPICLRCRHFPVVKVFKCLLKYIIRDTLTCVKMQTLKNAVGETSAVVRQEPGQTGFFSPNPVINGDVNVLVCAVSHGAPA